MDAIFLSASIPRIGRGAYHETASPFLIQCAVREFVIAVIRNWRIVWGGHPAITPMIASICTDLGVNYWESVVLYQSRFFEAAFPQENDAFRNVVLVDAVDGDEGASLRRLREVMLSRADLRAAVFIGGMEGVEAEFALFRHLHKEAAVIPVAAPGGAALRLAERLGMEKGMQTNLDFAGLFHSYFDTSEWPVKPQDGGEER